MLTRAVFDKTFKASDKFKEPDLQTVDASYLYSDGDGSYFLDQETFETVTLNKQMVGEALDFLVEGAIIHIDKYNGNPIGLQLPAQVELAVTYAEPGVRGDTASGSVTKPAKLETGIEIRVPVFIKEGEKIRVDTETRKAICRAGTKLETVASLGAPVEPSALAEGSNASALRKELDFNRALSAGIKSPGPDLSILQKLRS